MAKKSAARKPVFKKSNAKKRPAMKRSGTQVVAKSPASDRPKKGPDGLTDEQRLKRLGESKENLRVSSYHEAGHAVWAFLDGRLDSIRRIRIAYRDGNVGYIDYRYGSYALKHKLDFGRAEHQQVKSGIAAQFSGPVCEYIYTKENDSWGRMLDEWYDSDEKAGRSTPESQCDFQNAVKIASCYLGITYSAPENPDDYVLALFQQVWGWTQEVFAEPKVWKVVKTLAQALIEQSPGTMWGKDIQPLIRDSWKGPRNQVPMAYLGEPYLSRFGVEAGLHRPF